MATFEEQLDSLLERAKSIVPPNKLKTAAEKQPADKWMNDVQIFYDTYLKNHALGQRINTILFHRSTGAFEELVSCLESVRSDKAFVDEKNGISTVNIPRYRAKDVPEYDVFISHANKDKENLIEELYSSLKTLGVTIFYDKESLELSLIHI